MVPRSTDVTIKSKQVNQNQNKIKQTNKTIKCSECVQQNTKTFGFLCYDQHMRLMCDDYILHFMTFHIIKLLDPGWFVRLVDNIAFSPHCSRLMKYSVITKSNVILPVNVLLFVSGSNFDSNYLITVGTRGNRIQYSTYLTHQWRHELWSCGD